MRASRFEPAFLYGALAVLLWSTVSTAFKLSLRYLSPLGLLFFSSLVSTLFLFAYLFIFHRNLIGKEHLKNLILSLKAGILNPFVYYLMLFNAYHRLPAQQAQVLNYTWAIVLPLMTLAVRKERLKWRDIGALLFSFVGVIIISTKGNLRQLDFTDPIGVIIAISTSVVWAGYWIINMQDQRPAIIKLSYNFLVGTLLILVWSLATMGFMDASWFIANISIHWGILAAVWVGIFEMGFTFLIWYKALEKAPSTASVSNLIFITPFLALVFIRIILREPIFPATIIGLVIIIASNILQKIKR